MKRKLQKALLLILMVTTLTPWSVQASTVISGDSVNQNDVVIRIEETKYYYMEIRGVMHKRLWSVTNNCWIDPVWYPC